MGMAIADVIEALMSVTKICDTGNTVVFEKDGGIIKSNKSGDETKFIRENHVHPMTVKLHEPGFTWQG